MFGGFRLSSSATQLRIFRQMRATTPELAIAIAAAVVDPADWAVPRLLVPSAVGTFAELPAPLGSLTALSIQPRFAGPFGRPD